MTERDVLILGEKVLERLGGSVVLESTSGHRGLGGLLRGGDLLLGSELGSVVLGLGGKVSPQCDGRME